MRIGRIDRKQNTAYYQKSFSLNSKKFAVFFHFREFKKEMRIFRDFFRLNANEVIVITASEIEDDKLIRDFLGLRYFFAF